MKKPLVSILIPVYNVADYLGRCLDSVLAQTLKNIEVICVDDGSTDNSLEILEKYREKDDRVIIVSKENGGLPSARNAGINAAQGKFIGFVDSDDYIEPDMYRRMSRAAEKNHSDIVICGANIFPEIPRANQWLYDTLSPKGRLYKEFVPEVIFQAADTTPFLWRVLIRKSLLDAGNYRLDEDIQIGEDKAFQCKVYPDAKGITVIPDKLYNYFWCRPDSLMSQVYGDLETKIAAHVNLVENIMKDLKTKVFSEKIYDATWSSFFEWSIAFVYNDFTSASCRLKGELSRRLISSWRKAGYQKYLHRIPEKIRDMYDYICLYNQADLTDPEMTVITELKTNSRFTDQWLKTLKQFNDTDIECIIVNNGGPEKTYNQVSRALRENLRLRLYNSAEKLSDARAMNIGLNLSSGKYITFLDTEDWYTSTDLLKKWYQFARERDLDYCPSVSCYKNSENDSYAEYHVQETKTGVSRSGGLNGDYQNGWYKKAFLTEKGLTFKDYATITGAAFLWEVYLSAEKKEEFDQVVYVKRNVCKKDWISTEDCELMLKGLNELCDRSIEKKSPQLHAKVFSLLNNDTLMNMVANSIRPNNELLSRKMEVKNSQINAVSALFSLLGKADTDMLLEGGLSAEDSIIETIYTVVQSRTVFLDGLN